MAVRKAISANPYKNFTTPGYDATVIPDLGDDALHSWVELGLDNSKVYTSGTLPPAADFEGSVFYVSDYPENQRLVRSNGTSWSGLNP